MVAFTSNIMPIAIAQGVRVRWLERGLYRSPCRFHKELHGAIDHFQDQVISFAMDGQQMARSRAWLDVHLDVDRSADREFVH